MTGAVAIASCTSSWCWCACSTRATALFFACCRSIASWSRRAVAAIASRFAFAAAFMVATPTCSACSVKGTYLPLVGFRMEDALSFKDRACRAASLASTALRVNRDPDGLQYRKRLVPDTAKTAAFVAHFVDDRARAASLASTSRRVQRDPDGLQYRKWLLRGACKTAAFVAHFVDDRREELDAIFDRCGIFVLRMEEEELVFVFSNNNSYDCCDGCLLSATTLLMIAVTGVCCQQLQFVWTRWM